MSLQNSLVQSSSPRGTTVDASYQASGCISELLSQRYPVNEMIVFSMLAITVHMWGQDRPDKAQYCLRHAWSLRTWKYQAQINTDNIKPKARRTIFCNGKKIQNQEFKQEQLKQSNSTEHSNPFYSSCQILQVVETNCVTKKNPLKTKESTVNVRNASE